MYRKYFIVLGENSSLAMKLDIGKKVCTIGGPDRLESVILDIIRVCFDSEHNQLDIQHYGTTSKIRVSFSCPYSTLFLAIRKMEAECGVQVVPTKKHGRLMR